jgi:Protein of unknown function (DUF2971)
MLKRVALRDKRHRAEFEKKLMAAEVEISSTRVADSRDVTDVPIIYHYTDTKGLIGILSEGQLWATDIRYLNDSSELRHAEEVQRQLLGEIITESLDGSLQKKLAMRAWESKHPFKGVEKTSVVCFCAEDDLLTQWKTYGSWGSGFSIGFNRKKLESAVALPTPSLTELLTIFGSTEANLARVRYSEEHQKNELRRAFNRYRESLSAEPTPSEIAKCADAIANNAALSASRFKHPAFESEKECRIVISSSAAISDLGLFFRPSSRTVIPYMKTPKQPDSKLPVVSITIGPTLDQKLSHQSVLALLIARGYYDIGDVEIKTSKIPLTRTD